MLPLTSLKHSCTRCKNSNKFGFNSLACVFGKRIPHGTNFACATCDYLLIEVLGSRDKEKSLQTLFEGFFFFITPTQ